MRDSLLDALKGYGIMLVVFAHIFKGVATRVIFTYHMPLFFFLSGAALVYSHNNGINVGKKIKTIIVPYFAFSFICFLYWIMVEARLRPIRLNPIFDSYLGETNPVLQQFINIFASVSTSDAFAYNTVLWYLPCLFCALILYCVCRKYCIKFLLLLALLSAALALICMTNGICIPWCFEISLAVIPFLYLGELLYSRIVKMQVRTATLLFVILLIVAVLVYLDGVKKTDLRTHMWTWGGYFLALLMIIISVLGIYLTRLYKVGALQWIGRNSLIIMCIHGPIYRVVIMILSVLFKMSTSELRHSFVLATVATVITILVASPFVVLINRYIPQLIGHQKK